MTPRLDSCESKMSVLMLLMLNIANCILCLQYCFSNNLSQLCVNYHGEFEGQPGCFSYVCAPCLRATRI